MTAAQAAKIAEAPASIPSQGDPPANGGTVDEERKSFVAVMKYLKLTRDELGTRPTKSQVEAATSAVSSIVSDLEKEVEPLVSGDSSVPGDSPQTILALKAFKEEVARTKAQMKLLPHVQILELDKKFRHYDAAVSSAEIALLTGKWKTEEGRSDWLHVLQSAEEPPSSSSLPSPFLTLSFPQIFSPGLAHGVPHLAQSPLPVATVGASFFAVPASRAISVTGTEYAARTGEVAYQGLGSLGPTPSMQRAGSASERPYNNATVVFQTSFDDHHHTLGGPYSGAGGRAIGAALPGSRLRVAGGAEEEAPALVIDEVLLRIIQDSVQSKPRSLDIRGHLFAQPLQVIPETLGFVDSLIELNVAENSLVVLPDSIGSLKKLQTLDASCNHLLEVPRSIGELVELKELDLHHNKLDELPVSIGNCEALEILHAEFNQIKGLPKAIGNLRNLRVLTLHLNQIVTLPMTIGQCASLVELDVHMNQLSAVPESIGRLTNLEKLNVSANHFSLQALPASLGQLVSLKELDLRENHIKVLPTSVTQLKNLKSLKLEGNPWKQPPFAVTEQGMQAVMDYLATQGGNKEGSGPGASGPLKGFNLFRRMHKKDEADKLASWQNHANTWGA